MHGAKHSSDKFLVIRNFFQLEQGRFKLSEKFLGFFSERLSLSVHHPSTFLTTARSCSGLNGFTIQPVAPAAFPSTFFSACDSVVRRIMGMNLQAGFARNS